MANRTEIVRLVADCIRTKPAAEWQAQLEAAGIPSGPINSVTQALSDVQAQHRAMVRNIAGIQLVGSPVRIDGERADSDLPPPMLGEHTREILGQAVSDAEFARLRQLGVVA